ncbi:MAG: DUF2079 domain-containing protein [Streptosporangiaceae bacterium]
MVSALRAGRQAAIERVSWRRSAHLTGVATVTAAIALVYSAYSLFLYYNFKTSAYDLTIFDQAIRSYAHFHLGISPLKGVHNGFGPHFSVLGDHFSPIIAALAPLYWLHDSPATLLVAQGVLFALAIPSLWLFTRRAFGGGRKAAIAGYLVAIAYGLSWPLAAAVAFDFHEAAFAPVLTAVAMERFQAGRLKTALIALAALLLVKEDMGLFVAGIGVWLALTRSRTVARQYLVAIGLVVVGVSWTAFATYVLIPSFGGQGDYYWAYSNLGKNVPQVIGHMIMHPRSSFLILFHPQTKVHTLFYLFGAFCFLPLLSPIVVAAVPLILERFLGAKFPNWWSLVFQYNSYLVVALVCAAVDGAARLDRWIAWGWGRLSRARVPWTTGKIALGCAAAMAIVAVYLVPRFPLGAALHASFYHRDAQANFSALADAQVPSGVSVQATQFLAPQLARRDYVLLLDGDGKHPNLLPQYVVADVGHRQFSFPTLAAEIAAITRYEGEGYTVIFSRHGYLVLRRPAKDAGLPAVPGQDPAGETSATGQFSQKDQLRQMETTR